MSNILLNALRCYSRRTLQNEALKFAIKSTQLRPLSVSSRLYVKSDADANSPSQKKTKQLIKITLIQQNQLLTVTTIEDAQKLARRRDLRLIKVQDLDPKSQRPVYRLATPAELLAEESAADSKPKKASTGQSKKSDKSLTIGSRINDNDLASRLKNIDKWLTKGHEVRILIQGSNGEDTAAEKIFEKIEAAVKEHSNGKITQKRTKDSFIKFNIIPVRMDPEKKVDNA